MPTPKGMNMHNRHIYLACFTNGKAFNHSEVDCKNKLKKHPKTNKFGCSESEHSHLFNKSIIIQNI